MGKKKRNLSRTPPKREAYKTVLIVCEGTKTEKFYFDDLIASEKLSSVNIQVHPGRNSDPKSVVETAIEKKQEEERYLPIDEVYCVIDKDSHSTFGVAQQLAKSKNIQLIVSYPCFEYWYLCHFIYHRAPIVKSGTKSAGTQCESLLNSHWIKKFGEKYEKSRKGLYKALISDLSTGIKNAANALNDGRSSGQLNPSTQVHTLVDMLRRIKQ